MVWVWIAIMSLIVLYLCLMSGHLAMRDRITRTQDALWETRKALSDTNKDLAKLANISADHYAWHDKNNTGANRDGNAGYCGGEGGCGGDGIMGGAGGSGGSLS